MTDEKIKRIRISVKDRMLEELDILIGNSIFKNRQDLINHLLQEWIIRQREQRIDEARLVEKGLIKRF